MLECSAVHPSLSSVISLEGGSKPAWGRMECLLPCLAAAVELQGWARSFTSEQQDAGSSSADTMHACTALQRSKHNLGQQQLSVHSTCLNMLFVTAGTGIVTQHVSSTPSQSVLER